MGVNTILTHSGRGDQSVEVRSVNPVVMRASTILFKDYDTWQKYPKSRSKPSRYSSENDVLIEKSVKYTDFFLLSIVYV